MEVFSSNPYAVGLNSSVQLNNFNKRVYLGNIPTADSFQYCSPIVLFDENVIKKLILEKNELKKLLSEKNIPVRLNIKELIELKEKHCKETLEIAASIAKNLPPALRQKVNLKDLKEAALLHDFGKVLIPQEILNKNNKLTPQEREIMDLHSQLGYIILKNAGVKKEILDLVKYHHDIYGSGKIVPNINLQILNLADKYSALREKRVYKQEYSPKKALTILFKEVKQGQIEPILFSALVKSVRQSEENSFVNKY